MREAKGWCYQQSGSERSDNRYRCSHCRNHWKRVFSLWKDDASRPRKQASGGQVLELLREAILRLDDAKAFESLNAGFHHHSAKLYAALRLLKTPPPQIN